MGSWQSPGICGSFLGLPLATDGEDIRGAVSSGPPTGAWTCEHASVSNKHQQAQRVRAWVAAAEVSPAGGTCPGAPVPFVALATGGRPAPCAVRENARFFTRLFQSLESEAGAKMAGGGRGPSWHGAGSEPGKAQSGGRRAGLLARFPRGRA